MDSWGECSCLALIWELSNASCSLVFECLVSWRGNGRQLGSMGLVALFLAMLGPLYGIVIHPISVPRQW